MLLIGYALNLAAWPLWEQYTMFSNWTMHFTTVSILLTFRAVRSLSFKNDVWSIFFNHLFYTLAIPCSIIVIVGYWGFIHAKTIEKHRADGPWYKVLCQYWIHLVPAVCCLVNTLISNIVLSRKPIQLLIAIGFSYCILNYGMTRLLGHPLYSFMPWDTFMGTFKVVMLMLLMFYISYMALCLLDEVLKP